MIINLRFYLILNFDFLINDFSYKRKIFNIYIMKNSTADLGDIEIIVPENISKEEWPRLGKFEKFNMN